MRLGGGAAGRGVRRVMLCGGGAPGLLWVLPVSVRRCLRGGEGMCVSGVGLGRAPMSTATPNGAGPKPAAVKTA